MSVVIFLAVYFAIGIALVQGALYISQYDLESDGFYRYRMIGFISCVWPIFLMLMVGYWCWVGYHSAKHWVRTL